MKQVFKSKIWREWVWPYLLIALVVVPLRSAIADSNWVPSGSMKPTLLEGELIYVNKLAYDLRFPLTLMRIARWDNPKAGDVVVTSGSNGAEMGVLWDDKRKRRPPTPMDSASALMEPKLGPSPQVVSR